MQQRTPGSKRVITALVPLGAVGALGAVVAGCGGGGSASIPHQPSTQPNSTTPNASKNGTTTALITIRIPARGALSQRAKRSVKYISQASAAIGVSIGTTGGPAPTPTYFSLPTPGPSPTSTTLPVGAPIGNDTVSVSIYDALPAATASPNLLSTGTTTATVASGQSQPIAVQALGVAQGVVLASGAASSFEVFENHPVAQATTIAATPVDADGYAITGTLASPVPFVTPAGIVASPATLTAAGTVTLTYAASQYAIGGELTAGLPLDTAPNSVDNFTVLATQYLFVVAANGTYETITAIDPVRQTVVGTAVTTEADNELPEAIAGLAGCSAGETALFAEKTNAPGAPAAEVTFGVPNAAASPTVADLTGKIGTDVSSGFFGADGTMLASDASCGAYSAGDAVPHHYTGFGSSGASVSATALSASGWTANSSVGIVGTTLYGTAYATSPGASPAPDVVLERVPLGGGTVTNVGVANTGTYVTDQGICVGGTTAYVLTQGCDGAYPELSSIPGLTPASIADSTSSCAVAPNGQVYLFTGSIAASQPAPTLISVAGTFGGVTTDGRYLAAASESNNPLTVQIYSLAASASPVPVGSPIPLTNAGSELYGAAFPH